MINKIFNKINNFFENLFSVNIGIFYSVNLLIIIFVNYFIKIIYVTNYVKIILSILCLIFKLQQFNIECYFKNKFKLFILYSAIMFIYFLI